MDNTVLWALYGVDKKGDGEVIGQRVSGLAHMLGCSRQTVLDAIKRLSKAQLLEVRSDGFTLKKPDAATRAWWQDARKRDAQAPEKNARKEDAPAPAPPGNGDLHWIEPLVARQYPRDSEQDRDNLRFWLRRHSETMLKARVEPEEVADYWREVLGFFANSDLAGDFCMITWKEGFWDDARRKHASNGKYAPSCINLLRHNTRTVLTQRRDEIQRMLDC
jgi:hypothetical protein